MSKKTYYETVEAMPRVAHPTSPRFMDLTGGTFGRLTALHFAGRETGVSKWACRCSCGNLTVVTGTALTSGISASCGCLAREILVKRNTLHEGISKYLMTAYNDILRRCKDPEMVCYHRYGGRGIRCKFDSVEEFAGYIVRELGDRPPGLTLDRINNDGHYEPGNLRWATRATQVRNTYRAILVEYNGAKVPLADLADQFGINYSALRRRVKCLSWPIETALSTPVRYKRPNRV